MLVNLKESGYNPAYKAELSNDLGVKFEVDVYAVDTSALSRSGEKSISYLALQIFVIVNYCDILYY